MGGDFGPTVTVPAVLRALDSFPKLHIFLVGSPKHIEPFLAKIAPFQRQRIGLVAADSVIASDVNISQAIRTSKGSSMRMALELVKEGQAAACVSAGNTGVLMGLATLLLDPLPGIKRPALMTVLPNSQQGKTLLLDLGANVQADSNMLVQFALMGSVYSQQRLNIKQPRIALLNIGLEENKGQHAIKQAGRFLKSNSFLNYAGYIEGNNLLSGHADVIVCDGFSGNIALKTMEGILSMLASSDKSKSGIGRHSWINRIMMRIIKHRLSKHFGEFNPDHYNGATLLGIRGAVIKSHGNAKTDAFAAAINQAVMAIVGEIPLKISEGLQAILARSDKA